jgi:hypothetical protein
MAVCMRCGVVPDDEVEADPVFGKTHRGHTLTGEGHPDPIPGTTYTEDLAPDEPWPGAPETPPEAPSGGPE